MSLRLYEGMSIREITEYLFVSDQPQPADLIFVFGGKRLERAERGVELYLAGLAPWILFAAGDKEGSGQAEAERFREYAISKGVPAEQILVQAASHNTLDHVQMSLPLVEHTIGWQNMRSVILVSAPHHMRRVKHVVAKHIPRTVTIHCCPDARTDITRDNWWHTEDGRELVYRELEKLRRYAVQGEI
jgi:uncharacterized SAM-binding protein YcdF (DUF218 family)